MHPRDFSISIPGISLVHPPDFSSVRVTPIFVAQIDHNILPNRYLHQKFLSGRFWLRCAAFPLPPSSFPSKTIPQITLSVMSPAALPWRSEPHEWHQRQLIDLRCQPSGFLLTCVRKNPRTRTFGTMRT